LPRIKSRGETGTIVRIETPGVARTILASGSPTIAPDVPETELRPGHQLSRRSLEIRFHGAIGRALHEELQLIRLERARRVLNETDLPIPKVAEASGFTRARYLAEVFRDSVAITPAFFRRESLTPSA
jgi:LacI family transcriptional regulator